MKRIKDFNQFILLESHEQNTQWQEQFVEELRSRDLSSRDLSKATEALDYLGSNELILNYGMMKFPWCVNAFLGDVDSILNKKYEQ